MRAHGAKRRAWMDVCGRQHGIIRRRQLLAAGLSSAGISRLLSAGDLKPVYRGIYLCGGWPNSWQARLLAATVLGDGHASHRAAAALWKIWDGKVIEVTTPNHPKTDAVVWHRRELGSGDQTQLLGIPVTSIHRTLIDLGDVVAEDVVENALDRALERRLTSGEWLRRLIDQSGTRGRKGAACLYKILDRGHERASWLERRFLRLLRGSALPPHFREFGVNGYFIDFAWPEVMLGVEVHGAKWHRNRKRWARDLARHNELTVGGWTVLHFTWEEIKHRPGHVIAEILTTYGRLALRLGPTTR